MSNIEAIVNDIDKLKPVPIVLIELSERINKMDELMKG